MKKLFILLIFICLCGCVNKQIYYLEDVKSERALSYFNIRGNNSELYTIIAYGKVSSRQIPNSYLKAKNRWNEGWKLLIKWENDTTYIFDPYNVFETVNIEAVPIKYLKMKDKKFYSIFYNELEANYLKISNLEVNKKLSSY